MAFFVLAAHTSLDRLQANGAAREFADKVIFTHAVAKKK